MCSLWTCSRPKREQDPSGRPAGSGVLWQMPVELHSTGLCAQFQTKGHWDLMLSWWSRFQTVCLETCTWIICSGIDLLVPPLNTEEKISVLLLDLKLFCGPGQAITWLVGLTKWLCDTKYWSLQFSVCQILCPEQKWWSVHHSCYPSFFQLSFKICYFFL